MKRYYCDFCGKEITPFNDIYRMKIEFPSHYDKVYEMCPECEEKIWNLIDTDITVENIEYATVEKRKSFAPFEWIKNKMKKE